MPTTVNGVGTHYYGRKNSNFRTAACRACNHVGNLESYDTRLWFVILFIPVIPLGRKRIIDACPSCRRHYAANANAFEQARQLQTSGALEQYRRQPSPDTALAAHGQFLAFHQHAQAAELRTAALQTFAGHVGLRVGLAEQLQQASSYPEAEALFEEAYALAPRDPGARAGAALKKMNRGELDAARSLLDFLEAPGAGQQFSLAPLDMLAGCYQRAFRHQEALELAAVLLRELPVLANRYQFRAFMRKSEKALQRPESLLPPRPFSLTGLFRGKDSAYAPWQRRLAIGGTIAVLVGAGLALNNEYIRRHRTLHVVNACGAPVQVQIDDGPAVAIDGSGSLTLAEGPHKVRVSGPVEETHDIALSAGYFDRWFRKPVWVLNPGGEAVLQEVRHVYSANPPPAGQRVIVGQAFFHGPNFDYIFEPAPHSLTVDQNSKEVVKLELARVEGHDVDAFHYVMATDPASAMDFIQRRLKRYPARADLFKAYLSNVTEENLPSVREFLRSGLDVRPVNVTWHRTYQSLAESVVPEAELCAQYERFLQADPGNASLLYLRGRAEREESKQNAYYRRAIGADSTLAWPQIGLAASSVAWGRWSEAAAALRKAKEHPPEDTDLLNELVHGARLSLGESEALIREYRARVDANPGDAVGLLYLIDSLVAAGKAAEVDAAIAAWEAKLPPEARARVGPTIRAMAFYSEGNAEACEALCAQTPALHNAPIRAQALVALGMPQQVADDEGFKKARDDAWSALALSVAFQLCGHTADADKWRERAREVAKEPGVAEVLGAKNAPTLEALSSVHVRYSDKALLLAALAERFPAKRKEYRDLAAKLNVRRTPPYLLVRRVIDGNPGPRP
jgi:tetratricopeptide (TPR) repeat protein